MEVLNSPQLSSSGRSLSQRGVTILSNFLSGLLETDAIARHGSGNIAGFPSSTATHANLPLFRLRHLPNYR